MAATNLYVLGQIMIPLAKPASATVLIYCLYVG
jgi:hypothetical protein